MFLACGVGRLPPDFHLMTHAFFKALPGAGSDARHGRELDMRKMGASSPTCPPLDLPHRHPGHRHIFPFAGFFSKDDHWKALTQEAWSRLIRAPPS
jgi:NADH:ubiquinone oxidoreductase subunit 5 (subunit L)/multisubunit Na+/H+ antiporter MnhA subunit